MKLPILSCVVSLALVSCLQEDGSKTQQADVNGAPSKSSEGTTSKPSGAAKADKPTSKPSKKMAATGAKLDEKIYEHFGAGVAAEGETMDLASVVAKSDDLNGKKVRLTGDVQSVCKKKGCWMFVADGDNKVRVKFKDYGFFVPLDCEGRKAVLEGTFEVSKTSVAELKHLLEDAGKKEEAAKVTKPRIEMKVMADGVALKRKS